MFLYFSFILFNLGRLATAVRYGLDVAMTILMAASVYAARCRVEVHLLRIYRFFSPLSLFLRSILRENTTSVAGCWNICRDLPPLRCGILESSACFPRWYVTPVQRLSVLPLGIVGVHSRGIDPFGFLQDGGGVKTVM